MTTPPDRLLSRMGTESGPSCSKVVGVVVMAYGTPAGPEDVEAYYTHVRRGRPPAAEQLADLQRRDDAHRGISPLLERTKGQNARNQAPPPGGVQAEPGPKHPAPVLQDAVTA